MSRRVNESARVLNFFKQADLGKAEVLYDLVREVMQERLAPAKAAKEQARKAKAARKEISRRVEAITEASTVTQGAHKPV